MNAINTWEGEEEARKEEDFLKAFLPQLHERYPYAVPPELQLPEPWVPVSSDYYYSDLDKDIRELTNIMDPATEAFELAAHRIAEEKRRWRFIRNATTEVVAALRIVHPREGKTDTLSVPYRLLEIRLSNQYPGVSSSDLRDVPISAILAAYTRAASGRIIRINAWKARQSAYKDPDVPRNFVPHEPLPAKFSRRPWFYALVAEQYRYLEEEYPDDNTANKMVELNSSVAPGSVRRWITRARNMSLLPPADWKRGAKNA